MSRVCLILILIPALWLAGPCLSAQEKAPVAWQTGSAVDRQLEQPLTASWKEIPLREMLQALARSQRVAIFLDRRVDPGRLIQFDATGDSLAVVLTRLTGQLQLGYCLVDSTIYIGPPEVTGKLATVAEVLHQFLGQLPEPWNKRAAKRVAMKWDLLASPRRLVTEQLQQAGMQVAMPESIPHDLWAAGELPPMPLAEEVTLRRVYRKSVSTANFQRIRDFFPDLEVTRSEKELTAVGRQEDHRQLARLLRGEQVTTPRPGPVNKRYRLKVEQGTIRQILEEIARQDGLQLDVDEESRQRWDKLTDLDARDVTIEKLLEMVLSPAKLAGRVEGKKLIIRPAKP